jgi:hypothetical protein
MEIDEKIKIASQRWRLQSDPKDNPFSAVYNFLNLSGHLIPKETVKLKLPLDFEKGSSMHGVETALKDLGIKAMSLQVPQQKLGELPLPALLLIKKKESHEFVVLYKVAGTDVAYLNPRLGWLFESADALMEKWEGHIIIATPGTQPKDSIPDIDHGIESEVLTIMDDFLSLEECDFLIKESQSRLQKSQIVGKYKQAMLDEHARKSMSAFFVEEDNSILNDLYARVSKKLGFSKDRFEHFQCVSYNPGDFFDYHFDTMEPDADDPYPNPRSHTLLVYLNDNFVGGETAFPALNRKITPKKRRAVLFSNLESDGSICKQSVHAGLPVIDGRKYALNLWIHQKPLKQA